MNATRHELRDHAFGDVEIQWMINGRIVAEGYFGGDAQMVSVVQTAHPGQDAVKPFQGAEATTLRSLGNTGHIERNDEVGPPVFQEGVIMSGLTLAGVFKELTEED